MRHAAPVLLFALLTFITGCGGGTSQNSIESSGSGTSNSRYAGGEKSIEDFGVEASGSRRSAILAAEQGYLNAVAAENATKACFYLSAPAHRSLFRFADAKSDRPGCGVLLSKLLSPSASVTAHQQGGGKVTKVRVQRDRAFVVFLAPGAELYQFTMVREGGYWKAATVASSVLVPSAAVLGQ
ncbi:MAG TPA: hypothetical protein VN758_08145 [Solirubrobacterales bacterium]|nr:hypothetical protein [Solirubrobacterales bacterium]